MEDKTQTISEGSVGQRLDIFCTTQLPHLSRSAIQKAIKEGRITVNNETVKPRYALRENDTISFDITENTEESLPIEQPKLEILHEDKNIVVINKPAGIEAHPGQVPNQPTVSGWFAERYPDAQDVGEQENRPGIVHRLDKETSGVMVLAKHQESYEYLKKQFQKHRVQKEYLALVFGIPGGSDGRIVQALARSKKNPLRRTINKEGKPAITEWKKEDAFNSFALLRVFPLTGRTHQIRVHLHFIGHPIVGDRLYTFKRQKPPHGVTHHLLHAEKLTINLQQGKRKTFTAPIPEDFQAVIKELKK